MYFKRFFVSLAAALVAAASAVCAAEPDAELQAGMARIAAGHRATVGAAVLVDDRLVTCNDVALPLMSVFKVHVAYAVLHRMEREAIPLDTLLHISADRMHRDTYSPLRELHPEGDFSITAADLIRYSVSHSDNNACDLLIDFAGGIERVDSLIRMTSIGPCRLAETEADMHADVMASYGNRSTPSATVRLLDDLLRGGALSEAHAAFLYDALVACSTGAAKIRAGLPAGTEAGSKTGSSDRLPDGTKIGDNDAGFFRLPDGRICYLAVFVSDSHESDEANARLIADMARFVYGYLAGEGR